MDFHSLISDVIATILGGVVLALLFFWLHERIFPLPKVTGRWYFEMRTTSTSYEPYRDMTLRYVAMLWRVGKRIEGSAEKIYENSSTGKREYIGENRTRSRVEGYIEKNYFDNDRVFLHVIEDGQERESTHFFELRADSSNVMSGTFSSMVASQDGNSTWQRNQF